MRHPAAISSTYILLSKIDACNIYLYGLHKNDIEIAGIIIVFASGELEIEAYCLRTILLFCFHINSNIIYRDTELTEKRKRLCRQKYKIRSSIRS